MDKKQQIKQLFVKYLLRDPTNTEYDYHLNRNAGIEQTERELQNSSERKDILDLMSFERESDPSYPNIAILLAGHIRDLKILPGLRPITKQNNVDIFVFTWDNIGIKGTEQNVNADCNAEYIQKQISQIPNLRSFKIENNAAFVKNNENKNITYFNYSSPEVFIKSQLYSVHQCYKLMEEYAKNMNKTYDLVLKSRMDLKFTQFIVDDELIEDISRNIIFAPNEDVNHNHPDYGTSCWACDNMYHRFKLKHPHIFEHTNVVCDVFAYGSMKSMKEYCSMYEHYDKINESFVQENLKAIKQNPELKPEVDGNVYKLLDFNNLIPENHLHAVYYLNCSFPERILTKLLRNYMLPKSNKIKMYFTSTKKGD